MKPLAAPPAARSPERWSVDAGDADFATLDIPADLHVDRSFEIDCRFVVRTSAHVQAPSHSMTVLVDGAQQWSRSIPTANAGATESLDYHFRRHVPAGQALRITANTSVRNAARVRLLIEAEEN